MKHTRVKDLTVSERQRLNVASQLLLDTDIVVLDQVRKKDFFYFGGLRTRSRKRDFLLLLHTSVEKPLYFDNEFCLFPPLPQPTRGMDIFDTFFLVEYLRQWAARGRIVLVTLQPPTYEILTMISKVVLLSTGRVMYAGKRREMLPYFAFIEYPCPAYKNPSDYYREKKKFHFYK